jgi:hypothetical protein
MVVKAICKQFRRSISLRIPRWSNSLWRVDAIRNVPVAVRSEKRLPLRRRVLRPIIIYREIPV